MDAQQQADLKAYADRLELHAFAGQASGMPQHVDVDREWQLGAFACAFDHPGDAHAAEGLAALIDEDIGWLDPALGVIALQGLETGELVALQIVAAVGRAFEAAHASKL